MMKLPGSCRTIAQQVSKSCSGGQDSSPNVGHKWPSWVKCWPMLARLNPNVTKVDQQWPMLVLLDVGRC